MNTLLVVEDEVITSELLRRYFEIVGYRVLNALTGSDALKKASEEQPRVIILDILLPDMDGYEVCKKLRANEHTRHIPIIFLTQKDDRRDRLSGLELGADDYITKPFDIEELRLRVHNILERSGGPSLVDPRTSLPSRDLIKERLPRIIGDPDSDFFDIHIAHFGAFSKRYGPVAANQAIRGVARLIGDLLHEIDPESTFIGHPQDDRFLVAAPRRHSGRLKKELPERMSRLVAAIYDHPDLERGSMDTGDGMVPLMTLTVEPVTSGELKQILEGKDVSREKTGPAALPAPQKRPALPPPPEASKITQEKAAQEPSAAPPASSAVLPPEEKQTPGQTVDAAGTGSSASPSPPRPQLKLVSPIQKPPSEPPRPAQPEPHRTPPRPRLVVVPPPDEPSSERPPGSSNGKSVEGPSKPDETRRSEDASQDQPGGSSSS
jgi:CheY-like chemotaxis protein